MDRRRRVCSKTGLARSQTSIYSMFGAVVVVLEDASTQSNLNDLVIGEQVWGRHLAQGCPTGRLWAFGGSNLVHSV